MKEPENLKEETKKSDIVFEAAPEEDALTLEEEEKMMEDVGKSGHHKQTKLRHALLTFGALIAMMAVSIIHFEVDPHVPMFLGVVLAALMALYLGYKWVEIETAMMNGIFRSLQAIVILIIIGVLTGVWIVSGVVPTMIYYGLKLLSPSIFLVASVLICSITSLATGTSWGTMGTMGLALMGIAIGLGIPAPAAAGAILSGAYFGDKLSPLSDTTNLAPAMAGTDVFTHIKFMLLPTLIAYGIALVAFGIMSRMYIRNGVADTSAVAEISEGIRNMFVINPLLLLPPVIVIVAIALKIPAIPGITLGIISGGIIGIIAQGDHCTFGAIMDCGLNGFKSTSGMEDVDKLLSSGGILNMMPSVALTIIAMMFGGIMEKTKQMEVVVNKLMSLIRTPGGMVAMTEVTCIFSNVTMPEQYISIVVPGRMFAGAYKKMGLHPKSLSNALESAGTVTSCLVPWNTCGVFISGTLHISPAAYGPFAIFNYAMPIVTAIMAYLGFTVADQAGKRLGFRRKPTPEADA